MNFFFFFFEIFRGVTKVLWQFRFEESKNTVLEVLDRGQIKKVEIKRDEG